MERLPNLIIFLNLLLMASTLANAHVVKSMFPFGDSLFDPGNNHFTKNCTIQADFPPYGSTFFKRPTGRFTNGRTVADFISQYLGMELQLPYQELRQQIANGTRKEFPDNGISFASAGSGLLNTNEQCGISPIQVQLQQFQALIDNNHIRKDQIQNSLFLLESGSNDIFDFHISLFPRLFPSAHVDKLVKQVVNVIDKLTSLGARRIAIFGVGPMGCIPATVLLPHLPIAPQTACNDRINNMVTHYNNELQKLVNDIPKKYPGVKSLYGAVYDVTQTFRADPKSHGFANVNEACCGAGPKNGKVQCGLNGTRMCEKPSDFLFWDYFHPTEHTYELLAKAFWDGDTKCARPMNLQALVNT
ncbi:unnamed protein product [Lactuca saligna]|uniref:Uncharacterized protein n=1 Tax=Lactuca saligna TaxID=75948 RepID=A0AA35VCN7_LACSI|nr:unnamed protein product [Lactuca saligna]